MSTTLEAGHTVEDLLESAERGESYELVDGRFVEKHMSEESNYVGFRIAHLIEGVLDRARTGWLFVNDHPFDAFRDGRSVRKPDVAFVGADKLPDGPRAVGVTSAVPDLIVEVVSPNDRASELMIKLGEYRDAGVRLIWVVHPEVRQVIVYRETDRSPEVLADGDTLNGGDVLPGFEVQVADIFPPWPADGGDR